MKAVFVPAARSRSHSIAAALLASVLVVLTWVVAIAGVLDTMVALSIVVAFQVIAHLSFAFFPRPAAREVEIDLEPGRLRVLGTGHVIRARDVIGATSAEHEGQLMLHVDERSSPSPHVFLFSSKEDLDATRRALGVGHDGSGEVTWPAGPRTAKFAAAGAISAMATMGLAAPLMLIWPLLFARPRLLRRATSVAMTRTSVVIRAPMEREIPYVEIRTVCVDEHGLQLFGRGGALLGGIRWGGMDVQRELLASQIRAAARRARGAIEPRDVSAIDRLEQLRRRGQRRRDWLARLDDSASTIGQTGYRASPVDAQDLWRIAEDAGETLEDRVGAARVLLRAGGETARPRIDEALANLHVDPKYVRVAIEAPPEDAAEALAEAETMAMAEKRRV